MSKRYSCLADARALALARALLERRARSRIVSAAAGFRTRFVASLREEIGAPRPQQGHTTGPVLRCLKTPIARLHGAHFAAVYRAYGGEVAGRQSEMPPADAVAPIDGWLFVRAFDEYLKVCPRIAAAPLDINQAWITAQNLATGLAVLERCEDCRLAYLVDETGEVVPSCPYCELRSAIRRRTNRAVNL